MSIPDCYEAFTQAERREAELDSKEARRDRCGCCERIIEPGEHRWTVSRYAETFLLCRECKEEVDESETIQEEVDGYA